MTAKQREVLDHVHELLSEHFDGAVYVVDYDEGTEHEVSSGYNGGIAMAMGLCQHQIERLKARVVSDV